MLNFGNKGKIRENPFLIFSPFLLFYLVFVLKLHNNILWGDEARYLIFAQNLLHGFYSPPAPHVFLRNGPGYPLLLTPFVALHLPLLCIKLMNPVFHYLSVIFLFKALKQFVSFRKALIFSLFWACYYNSFDFMPLVYCETFTAFLISILILLLIKAFKPENLIKTRKYIYLSGFVIGYIALTKIIFGYVLLIMLIGSGLLWLKKKKTPNYRKSFIILLIALTTTAPYLIYTYHMTGKVFYWGSTGGNALYWMSTQYEDEYGSWFPDPKFKPDSISPTDKTAESQHGGQFNLKNRAIAIPGSGDSIKLHHQKDYGEINKYTGVERDDAFKRIAINNIKSNPVKYIKNCISNIGRMLFNYPYSYTPQKPGTLLRLPLNGIIVVLMLFCLIPTVLNWRRIIFPMRFVLFFTFLYLGGSIPGTAEIRMFTIIVPLLLFLIAFIMEKSIKISLKFDENTN